MEHKIIEKTIEVKAAITKVWSVFTNPDVTKQMGGYYDTNWKTGNLFGFKNAEGRRLTNGILLEFHPESLIKHSLFEPNNETVMATITYELHEKNGCTLLTGKEDLVQPLNKEAFADASIGWESALNAIKEIAESL